MKAFALLVVLIGIGLPLCAAHYPLILDFPTLVNHASMLRHYGDPQYHFHEQVVLRPLFSYANYTHVCFSAGLAFLFDPLTATKIAAYLLLLLIPAGMWVTLRAMGKSPYWILAAPPFIWGHMAHLGFINFLAAVGLCLGLVGMTARLERKPTFIRFIHLALVSLLIYFTHLAVVPAAIATILITGLFSPKSRKFVIYWILTILFLCFLLFCWNRVSSPGNLFAIPLKLDLSRIASFDYRFFANFTNGIEKTARAPFLGAIALVFCINLFSFVMRLVRKDIAMTRQALYLRASLAVLCLGSLFLYLYLPMEIGFWWGLYFRLGFMMIFFALLLLPDFPKNAYLRYAAVVLLGLSSLYYLYTVSQVHAEFDKREYKNFRTIVKKIPAAPKLYYESTRYGEYIYPMNIFQHFHEYIQAERGGWVNAGLIEVPLPRSLVRYRDRGTPGVVLPPNPAWVMDPFFEWYLIQSHQNPAPLFQKGLNVREVAHAGTWWLYRRLSD